MAESAPELKVDHVSSHGGEHGGVEHQGLRKRIADALAPWCRVHEITEAPCERCALRLDAVLAVLVEPPGDLQKQMAKAMHAADCGCEDGWDGTDLLRAKAALSVRWEDAARRIAAAEARADHAEGELSSRQYHHARWQAAEAQVAALQHELANRDTLLEKYRETVSVLLGQREKATALLRDLVDTDDCWFDHHGGCQAHGYLSLEPGERCPQAEAKELLAERSDALPSHPDVPEEIRSLAESAETET